MTAYPLDFHRRSEQKWARRAEVSSGCESTPRAVISRSQRARKSGQSERRGILARRPWLPAIGQWLRAEYNAANQPVPERLVALLKELKGRRH
jgi:hypothetical protein